MANDLPPVRRVVTAIDVDGKSYFLEDGPAQVHTNPARPGMNSSQLWATGQVPVPFGEPDQSQGLKGIMPPPGGSALRVLDYPPEPKDPAERELAYQSTRERIKATGNHPEPGVVRHPDALHPGMHETHTIDYAIVLSGEIWAIMDKGETLLKTGDVLVQRGTSHAWSNRSDEPCRVAFVMLEATSTKK